MRPAQRDRNAGRGNSGEKPASVSFPVVVEFARGNPTPRAESLQAMHRCGQWLARHREECVTVVGHANNRGQDKPAKALARARVAAVTDLLVLLGAKPAQLVPISAPRLHSVLVGSTRSERRQRRVVVIYRHEPPQAMLRRALRRVTGR